jgi:hypothetical protein
LKKVKMMTSYEIASLDYCFQDDEGYIASLRERTMWIRSKEKPSLSQFVNVTSQYNGSGAVFTFIPQLESEARSMVASLIPYFRYEFGDDIQKLFKPDAWEMHLEAKWDPELRVAVTPDDSRVDGLKDQDAEYQWEEVKEMEIETPASLRPDPNDKNPYGEGSDSVATFRTAGAGLQDMLEEAARQDKRSQIPAATAVTPIQATPKGAKISSTSSLTSTLDGSVESRLSILEASSVQTQQMVHDMMQMMMKWNQTNKPGESVVPDNEKVTTSADQYENTKPSGEEAE